METDRIVPEVLTLEETIRSINENAFFYVHNVIIRENTLQIYVGVQSPMFLAQSWAETLADGKEDQVLSKLRERWGIKDFRTDSPSLAVVVECELQSKYSEPVIDTWTMQYLRASGALQEWYDEFIDDIEHLMNPWIEEELYFALPSARMVLPFEIQ